MKTGNYIATIDNRFADKNELGGTANKKMIYK